MNLIGHFKTITEHRREVRKICFRLGLYYQGLTHDLSKYSIAEFPYGVYYYQGFRSPNMGEREKKGYSSAWLHHKGRNKHHFEYWTDYNPAGGGIVPARMPAKYLCEMYADRVAASKTYNKGHYSNDFPINYYLKGSKNRIIHEDTARDLEIMLRMLARDGEAVTEEYIRTQILKGHFGAFLAQKRYEHAKQIKDMRE